jgi:hypothetical protein
MLTLPIIGLLAGIAIVSVLGVLSARATARSVSKMKHDATALRNPGEVKVKVVTKDEQDRNKSNPDAMEMAAGGNKN